MAIQIRRGTDANFNANYSNLVDGEPIITTDTERFAVGVANGTFAEFANVELLASEFDDYQSYYPGDYCTYRGKLYKCISATETSSWDYSKWTVSTVDELIKAMETRTTALETSVDALGNVANLTYTVVSTF